VSESSEGRAAAEPNPPPGTSELDDRGRRPPPITPPHHLACAQPFTPSTSHRVRREPYGRSDVSPPHPVPTDHWLLSSIYMCVCLNTHIGKADDDCSVNTVAPTPCGRCALYRCKCETRHRRRFVFLEFRTVQIIIYFCCSFNNKLLKQNKINI